MPHTQFLYTSLTASTCSRPRIQIPHATPNPSRKSQINQSPASPTNTLFNPILRLQSRAHNHHKDRDHHPTCSGDFAPQPQGGFDSPPFILPPISLGFPVAVLDSFGVFAPFPDRFASPDFPTSSPVDSVGFLAPCLSGFVS
jgi:hypothetical protein